MTKIEGVTAIWILQLNIGKSLINWWGILESLEEIKERADIISLHVPLIKEGPDKTLHLIDKNFIQDSFKKPYIVNTSRGSVVNNPDLKKALEEKSIRGAVLDVWEGEPDLDRDLLKMVDIGTPHIAGYSQDGKAKGTSMVVQAISRFFNLDLNDWYPSQIPPPQTPNIEINYSLGKEDALKQAILTCYDISVDHKNLKTAPQKFEIQRDNYPVRREFNAFTISSNKEFPDLKRALGDLGFSMT